jgi:hypothetical protein
MFSCLGRLGCLAFILLILAGVAGWFTQDIWMPKVRARVGMSPAVSTATWEPVQTSGAARGREALAQLRKRSGPVFVQVRPADLASYAVSAAPTGALTGVKQLETRAEGDKVYFRGVVNTAELGAAGKSGPLSGVMDGMLRGDQQLTVGGRVEVTAPGHGVFHIDDVKVGELRLPTGAVRKLIAHYSGGAEANGGESLTFPLPSEIGDVRVQKGQITLYKSGK